MVERRTTPAHTGALLLASLALHGVFLLLVAGAPKPTAAVQEETGPTAIELVPWREPAEKARPGAKGSVAPTVQDPASTPQPTAAAATPEQPEQARTTSRTRPRSDDAAVEPAATTPTPAIDAEPSTPSKPAATALALQGLRDLDRGGGVAVPAPRISPSALGPASPGAAPAGPVLGDGGGTSDTPGSLAEAGFVRDKQGRQTYREPGNHFTAVLLPDGRVSFKDVPLRPTATSVPMPDLYRVVRKAQGGELWALQKSKLLEQTFDLRLAIAVAFAEKNVDRRLRELYRDMLEIWGDSDRPALARRTTIFDRWDECDEAMRVKLPGFEDASGSTIDELRQSAGTRARDEITGFIRKHLPASSEDAYASDELATLNRRRKSKARFDPYTVPANDTP